jgi:hypothetical protein
MTTTLQAAMRNADSESLAVSEAPRLAVKAVERALMQEATLERTFNDAVDAVARHLLHEALRSLAPLETKR